MALPTALPLSQPNGDPCPPLDGRGRLSEPSPGGQLLRSTEYTRDRPTLGRPPSSKSAGVEEPVNLRGSHWQRVTNRAYFSGDGEDCPMGRGASCAWQLQFCVRKVYKSEFCSCGSNWADSVGVYGVYYMGAAWDDRGIDFFSIESREIDAH
ncbi:hypothetical protein BJX96DRAFT_151677, partial [Aspergillus floccosus]